MATINSNPLSLLVLLLAATSACDVAAQTLRLGAANASPAAEFGFATALQGGRVVSGSPGEAQQAGAVYVHDCVAGHCAPGVRVAAVDLATGDLFGSALGLSAGTLAIAAPGQTPAAVYVFVHDGAAWVQQARIAAPDGALSAGFGGALALDGDRLVIGADQASSRAGAVYVYTRSGALWSFQARLAPIDGAAGDGFGSSLALSGDSVLVGAPFRAGAAPGSHARGAAYVYVHTLGSWLQQARLSALTAADGDSFGSALALDGDRAAIGAPLAGGSGRVHVYERQVDSWTEQAQLGAIDGMPGDRFGWAVGLDGENLVVGAPFARATCGASYRFRHSSATWEPLPNASVAVPRLGNLGGWSVAADDGRFIIGAPGFSGAADHRGAAYWFDPVEQIFADGMDDNSAVECVLAAG
jgi:hypothetical protein